MSESMHGWGRDDMVRISYCDDCSWSITADEILAEKPRQSNLARLNGLVDSRAHGHRYFERGHTTTEHYLPTEIHPDPTAEKDRMNP